MNRPDTGLEFQGDLPGDLRLILHRLAKRELEAFVVGPAVRDLLAGVDSEKIPRIDLMVIAPSLTEIEKALDGVSTATLFLSRPERVRRSLALAVHDSGTGNVIRKVVVQDVPSRDRVVDELSRREVTVNAIAIDGNSRILDPFGGVRDVANKVIRPIQAGPQFFVHKPLFIVKVAKHIAYHGFLAEPETVSRASEACLGILDVPPERVRPELERLLVNVFPDLGLEFLQKAGVLRLILPEVQSMVGFSDSCEVHHKDIWEHTKKVVFKSKPNTAIRWAALLHDIGKVWTRTVDDKGHVHFFRHEDLSAILFKGIAARFCLEDRLIDRVHFLISNHSRVNMYSSDWTDSAVRRMMREVGDSLDDLLSLSRADITSRQERRVEELTGLLDELERRIEAIRAEDMREPLLPKGIGSAIIEHFGLSPGPVVGQLRKALEDAVEAGELSRGLTVEEYLQYVHAYIHQKGKNSSI